jgi:predicted MPP superfamily phosphohydrolase
MNKHGVQRIKKYSIENSQIPSEFDGFRIAFISDIHYPSLLQEKGLDLLIKQLQKSNADVLLLGGDYVMDCGAAGLLFSKLAEVKTHFGTYAVLGNHESGVCRDSVLFSMQQNSVHLLQQNVDSLLLHKQYILVAGIANSFDFNTPSPTLSLQPDDYVILLAHHPDYAEKVNIANTDLFLAGHTHGGQCTLFGLYVPVKRSVYGRRFLRGLKHNSQGQSMIITNGIGTSHANFRFCAPSELVLITLKRKVK